MATVREDAARLRTVAAQFLDIARMSPHALELRPAPLDLRDCLPRWLQPFEPAAREAGVTLHCDVAPGLPPVFLDQERFAWVLSNLVSNALRAVPEGGAVMVGAELEGEGLLALRVADNGPGIDAELAGRLFEPFSHRARCRAAIEHRRSRSGHQPGHCGRARRHTALRARLRKAVPFLRCACLCRSGRPETDGGRA